MTRKRKPRKPRKVWGILEGRPYFCNYYFDREEEARDFLSRWFTSDARVKLVQFREVLKRRKRR